MPVAAFSSYPLVPFHLWCRVFGLVVVVSVEENLRECGAVSR